jgi:hypothetical protein
MAEKLFVCKRCKRTYPYPEAGARPIRCECGWWYYNDGAGISEALESRIGGYEPPASLRNLFPAPDPILNL